MANPSTEGGTGAGTEVIRRKYTSGGTGYSVMINGVADHIYTVVSLTITNMTAGAGTFGIRVMIDGSTSCTILDNSTTHPAAGTFVFNDKLSLVGTDHLEVYTSVSSDIYVTYIDQQFA